MAANIVILIPGTTGTTLIDPTNPGTPVWPQQVKDASNDPQKQLALLEQSNLVPGELSSNCYGTMISNFTGQGYTYVPNIGALAGNTPSNLLLGFPYDWRKDNTSTAGLLAQAIAQVSSAYQGACNIFLVAHSMGGLISRYVLESGQYNSQSWWPQVKTLITLGTPHLGAPMALGAITGNLPPIVAVLMPWLTGATIESFVDDPQYDSTFELLPPPAISFVADSTKKSYPIYSGAVNTLLTTAPSAGFGAPASSFTAAQAFFSKLDYTTAKTPKPYYLAVGTNLPTPVSFTYNPSGKTPKDQLSPNSQYAGDCIVPDWSAAFSGNGVSKTVAGTQRFATVDHMALCTNAKVFSFVTASIKAAVSAGELEPA